MTAQEELTSLFRDIEVHTDRALEGLERVRSGTKLQKIGPSAVLSSCQLGLATGLVLMTAKFLQGS